MLILGLKVVDVICWCDLLKYLICFVSWWLFVQKCLFFLYK